MENYKGVYYNDTKEQKFYEGGAHFKFKDLFNILKVLGGVLPEEDHINPSISFIKNKNNDKENILDINLNSIFNEEKEEKLRHKTRNINQFNYINNPNTQITFNKTNKSKNNNLSIKKSYMAQSRNIDKNSIFFDEMNKNYNNFNGSTFNSSIKNNLKNNLTQTLLHKRRNNLNSEEKINNIDSNSHYIYLNNLKYIHNRNRSDAYIKSINNNLEDIKKYHVMNKNLKASTKKVFIPKYKYNFNYSNNINDIKLSQFNNNNNNNIVNTKLNIRKNNYSIANGKDSNNYFKDKLDNNLLNNYNFINYGEYSKNVFNKNVDDHKKTFEFKKDIDYKGKYINNFFDSTNENKIDYLKDSNSGMNMNKYINGAMNNKRYVFCNNLSMKNNLNLNLNINDKNLKNIKNDSLFQKYIKKRISQLSIFNNNNLGDIGRNINKNMSRNMKSMSNNYNYNYTTQNLKFKTSSGIKYINKYNFKK